MAVFTAPTLRLDSEKIEAFEGLYRSAVNHGGGLINYTCGYPKHEFLRYLVTHRSVLLHGSTNRELVALEPGRQTDFSGKIVTAAFATGDGIWPIFFAIVDRSNFRGSLRNGCFVVTDRKGRAKRFYFFSINQEMLKRSPWTDGMIYVLPQASFKPTDTRPIRFDEWASEEPVHPLAKLPVCPADFPFLNNITGHDEEEPVFTSWVRFKQRQHR